MTQATISELKNSLSAYIRKVKLGESVLIMDRKTPVARLVPLESDATLREQAAPYDSASERSIADEARLAELEREGLIIRSHVPMPLDVIRSWKPIKDVNLLQALLDEREEDYQTGYR